jgi:hypothetical protein
MVLVSFSPRNFLSFFTLALTNEYTELRKSFSILRHEGGIASAPLVFE